METNTLNFYYYSNGNAEVAKFVEVLEGGETIQLRS